MDEVAEIAAGLIPRMLRGAAILRPVAPGAAASHAQIGGAVAVAMGAEGEALRDGVVALSDHLAGLFAAEVG